MIKSYILDDGSEFKTVTLPKGTILFRGFNFQESDRTHVMYKEFIDDGDCCPPTKNVFFYPAPYVSYAVENYNVHAIYHTIYDLELLLMIKPSEQYRFNKDDKNSSKNPSLKIIKRCSDISEKDSCGHDMSTSDPCFTDYLITNYPNILGYVGLNKRDVGHFFRQYQEYLKYKLFKYISHILPSVVSNSRDIVGTPEIVLHPLHFRKSLQHPFVNDFFNAQSSYRHFMKHSGRYNFKPIIYVTKEKIYSFSEMENKEIVEEIKRTEAPNYDDVTNKLLKNMSDTVSSFLSSDGNTIDNIKYNFYIDKKTGFYNIINQQQKDKTVGKTRKVKKSTLTVSDDETDIETHVPISYILSPVLNSTLMDRWSFFQSSIQTSQRTLNALGHSMTPEYVFDKGQYKVKYKIESMFPAVKPKQSQIIKSTLKVRKSST